MALVHLEAVFVFISPVGVHAGYRFSRVTLSSYVIADGTAVALEAVALIMLGQTGKLDLCLVSADPSPLYLTAELEKHDYIHIDRA